MRQHVNPLSSFFQLPLELPPPEQLFRVPDQPIHLDIGCARGRCLLGLAERDPHWNHLGVEIRRPLVTCADQDALASEHGNVRILFCNANISLEGWMKALKQDRLQRVSIQFPRSLVQTQAPQAPGPAAGASARHRNSPAARP